MTDRTIETIEAAQDWADRHGEAVDISITRNGNVVAGKVADALAHSTVRPLSVRRTEALVARMAMLDRMIRRHKNGETVLPLKLARYAHQKAVEAFMEWAAETQRYLDEVEAE